MQAVTLTIQVPLNPTAQDFANALSLACAQLISGGDMIGGSIVAQLGYVAQVAASYSTSKSPWANSLSGSIDANRPLETYSLTGNVWDVAKS